MIWSPDSNFSNNPQTSTNFRSDMQPSYACDTNDIAPLGVTPIKTFTVFLFLYDENVHACDKSEEGRSIENSVASMMILVLG